MIKVYSRVQKGIEIRMSYCKARETFIVYRDNRIVMESDNLSDAYKEYNRYYF